MKMLRPALGLAALFLIGCHQSEPPPRTSSPAPVEVGVLEITPREIPVHEEVVGTVQPELRATISSKVLGRIVEMHATPGKVVTDAAILGRIATPQLEAALTRAEASLANATSEAKRFKAIRESGSQAVSEREIDQAIATLAMATAERDLIRSQLDDATVKAPFAGRITHKLRDTGDLVQPGTPICRIEDPTRLRFEMNLAESLAGNLTLGEEFPVRIEALEADLAAKIAEISPAADTGSRTFLVKMDLPPNSRLLAGQFGRALIPRGTKPAITIPDNAIVQRGQMTLVAVAGSDKIARLRIVRTGSSRDGEVEILAGLAAGELLVSPLPGDLESGTPLLFSR